MTRDELIVKHMPLARYTAERLKGKLPACIDIQDLLSAAYLGLVGAATKYDDSRGVQFDTYASLRIRGAMLDDLRAGDWVPRLIRNHTNKIESTRDALAYGLGREPTDPELAAAIGIPIDTLLTWLEESEVRTQLPIDAPYSESADESPVEFIEDRAIPPPTRALELEEVRAAVARLHGRERRVVQMYYFDGLKMMEIGAILGVSESRICQLHTIAIERLRSCMADHETVALCICCEDRQRSRQWRVGLMLRICDYCYSLGFKPLRPNEPTAGEETEEMTEGKTCAGCKTRKVSSSSTPQKLGLCFTCYMKPDVRAARYKELDIVPRDTRAGARNKSAPAKPKPAKKTTALATIEKPKDDDPLEVVGGEKTREAFSAIELVPAPTPIPGLDLRRAAMKAAVNDLCRTMAHEMVDEIFDDGGK